MQNQEKQDWIESIPFDTNNAYNFAKVLNNSKRNNKDIKFLDDNNKDLIDDARILNGVLVPSYLKYHFRTVFPVLVEILKIPINLSSEKLAQLIEKPEEVSEDSEVKKIQNQLQPLFKKMSDWFNIIIIIAISELFDKNYVPLENLLKELNDPTNKDRNLDEKKAFFASQNIDTNNINKYRLLHSYIVNVSSYINQISSIFAKNVGDEELQRLRAPQALVNRFTNNYLQELGVGCLKKTDSKFNEKEKYGHKLFTAITDHAKELLQEPKIRYLVARNYKVERLLNYLHSKLWGEKSKFNDIRAEAQLESFLRKIDIASEKSNPDYANLANLLEAVVKPFEDVLAMQATEIKNINVVPPYEPQSLFDIKTLAGTVVALGGLALLLTFGLVAPINLALISLGVIGVVIGSIIGAITGSGIGYAISHIYKTNKVNKDNLALEQKAKEFLNSMAMQSPPSAASTDQRVVVPSIPGKRLKSSLDLASLSLLTRTWGPYSQVLVSKRTAVLLEPSDARKEILGFSGFLYLVFIEPLYRIFGDKYHTKLKISSLINPIKWLDYIFENLNGFCDFIASRGGSAMSLFEGVYTRSSTHTAGEFVYPLIATILRLPVTLIQNLTNIVFHPSDTFIQPYVDIYNFSKNDRSSGQRIVLLAIMQTFKIFTILGLLALAVGSVFGLPFLTPIVLAINSLPILSLLSTVGGGAIATLLPITAVASIAIETFKTGADLSAFKEGFQYLMEQNKPPKPPETITENKGSQQQQPSSSDEEVTRAVSGAQYKRKNAEEEVKKSEEIVEPSIIEELKSDKKSVLIQNKNNGSSSLSNNTLPKTKVKP